MKIEVEIDAQKALEECADHEIVDEFEKRGLETEEVEQIRRENGKLLGEIQELREKMGERTAVLEQAARDMRERDCPQSLKDFFWESLGVIV